MSYFLCEQVLEIGKTVEIQGEEARHILLSRRIKKGEQILLQGKDGKRFAVEVVAADKKSLSLKSLNQIQVPPELSVKITLFQSVVNEKALDFIFQKATELGAVGITLFNSQNTAAKLSGDQFISKSARWNKILWESAKQCDRSIVPELKFLSGLDEVIGQAGKYDQFIILDASGERYFTLTPKPSALALCIGPEGGLAPLELDRLKTIPNSSLFSLSPFTLRAETAAIAGLVIIQ